MSVLMFDLEKTISDEVWRRPFIDWNCRAIHGVDAA